MATQRLNVMKTLHGLFDRFYQLDTAMNRWLVAHSIALLRLGMGLVFWIWRFEVLSRH